MRETWYVLEDGRTVDPNECGHNEAGVMAHSSGVPVAMKSPGVLHSRGVDAEEERAKASHGKSDKGKSKAKDVKPDDHKEGYKTRESKAD